MRMWLTDCSLRRHVVDCGLTQHINEASWKSDQRNTWLLLTTADRTDWAVRCSKTKRLHIWRTNVFIPFTDRMSLECIIEQCFTFLYSKWFQENYVGGPYLVLRRGYLVSHNTSWLDLDDSEKGHVRNTLFPIVFELFTMVDHLLNSIVWILTLNNDWAIYCCNDLVKKWSCFGVIAQWEGDRIK